MSEVPQFKFIGDDLTLDFSNTADDRGTDYELDRLATYHDLLTWGHMSDTLAADEEEQLERAAMIDPAAAEAMVAQARVLREAIYRTFSAVAAEREPADGDLDILNDYLQRALAHARIAHRDGDFGWSWQYDNGEFERVLWPVARSAADLLTSEELRKVRECGNGNCSWLFLDLSRNHSRRWCTMEGCGNQVKARRHYVRQTKGEG